MILTELPLITLYFEEPVSCTNATKENSTFKYHMLCAGLALILCYKLFSYKSCRHIQPSVGRQSFGSDSLGKPYFRREDTIMLAVVMRLFNVDFTAVYLSCQTY